MVKKLFKHKNIDFNVPEEQKTSVLFGIASHLGPTFLFVIILLFTGFSISAIIVSFLAISLIFLFVVLRAEKKVPSVLLPSPTKKEVKEGLSLVFLKGFVIGGLVVVLFWWFLSFVIPYAGTVSSWWVIIIAVLLTDFAYYWIHRSLNHGRGNHFVLNWYRKNHALHHSVSELDFYRGNISTVFDTAVTGFQIPIAIIASLMGMDLATTLVAYGIVLQLQATHHANFTFNISLLSYIFMDNHAHKFHHCKKGYLVNHGALFSLWDRLFGTYYENWKLSSNYLHFHKIGLPIERRYI